MIRSMKVRTPFLEALYICRAIFHDAVIKGGSMSFFNHCVSK